MISSISNFFSTAIFLVLAGILPFPAAAQVVFGTAVDDRAIALVLLFLAVLGLMIVVKRGKRL